jgi:hypothetical protein
MMRIKAADPSLRHHWPSNDGGSTMWTDFFARADRNFELMHRMQSRLGVAPGLDDTSEIEQWARAARNCAFCRDTAACKAWLDAGGPGTDYRRFCPNADLMERSRLV